MPWAATSRQAPVTPPSAPAAQALFRPEALACSKTPIGNEWQQPDKVMDELHIADGSRVADVGAGGGWFTTRLARRVGPNGAVYAEDVQKQMVEAIEERARQEGLSNVHAILSSSSDPMLPPNLDAVLIVDAYGQLAHPIDVLDHIAAALARTGASASWTSSRTAMAGPVRRRTSGSIRNTSWRTPRAPVSPCAAARPPCAIST